MLGSLCPPCRSTKKSKHGASVGFRCFAGRDSIRQMLTSCFQKYRKTSCRIPTRSVNSISSDVLGGCAVVVLAQSSIPLEAMARCSHSIDKPFDVSPFLQIGTSPSQPLTFVAVEKWDSTRFWLPNLSPEAEKRTGRLLNNSCFIKDTSLAMLKLVRAF